MAPPDTALEPPAAATLIDGLLPTHKMLSRPARGSGWTQGAAVNVATAEDTGAWPLLEVICIWSAQLVSQKVKHGQSTQPAAVEGQQAAHPPTDVKGAAAFQRRLLQSFALRSTTCTAGC